MRYTRRIAGIFSGLLLIPLVLVGGLLLFAQIAPGRAFIIWAAETLVSSDDQQLRIGGLTGRIPFDMTVSDVAMADADGTWLAVDKARLVWRPFSLAAGVLSVQMVDVGTVDLRRLPAPAEDAQDDSGGGFPVLPFEVVLDRLSVGEVALGEPVLGIPAAVSIEGEARLGDPSDGLSVRLDVDRIDGTDGRITARLAYAPDTESLDLDLVVDEPAGGLVSRLSGIPGLPPLRAELAGTGPIDDWTADLTLAAADQGNAAGRATITRRDDGRTITADFAGSLAGLLQPAYAPLAEGRSTLTAQVFVPTEAAIEIERAEVLTAAGLVSVKGTFDPDSQAMALDYEVIAGQAQRFSAILPVQAAWRGIEIVGRAGGSVSQPDITARLAGEGLSVEGNAVEMLALDLSARAQGSVEDPDTEIALKVSGRADGFAPMDAAYSSAAGETVTLDVTGTVTPAGRFTADPARIVLGSGQIQWVGVAGPDRVDGDLAVSNVDLSAFAGLADMELRGEASLKAQVSGLFDGSMMQATLDGGATGFGTGIAQVDGALGDTFTISGGVERGADGSFAFDDLVLSGAALRVTADGSADTSSADVTAEIDLPDLARLDPQVTGAATVTARLTGSIEDLAVQATAAIDEATAMGQPITGLKLTIDAQDVTGRPSGTLALEGAVDRHPLTGRGRLSSLDNGGADVQGLDLTVGSVRVFGDLSVDGAGLAQGRLSLKAADLGDLSSLLLTELAGKVDATVDLAVENGVQLASVKGVANGVDAFDVRIGSADVDATVRDPAGTLTLDADIAAKALDAGGQRIDELKLTAQGGTDENTVSLSARALGASLDTRGAVALVDGNATVTLNSLTLTGGGQTGTLARPATIRVADGGVAIEGFNLTTGGGGVTVDGTAGETLDLNVAINALPLSLADIAMPGTGISGTLSGRANLSGPATAPGGDFTLKVSALSLPAMREAGVRPADIDASGRLANGRSSIEARITSASAATLKVSGSVPLSADGALDVALKGRIDLAMLNDMLAASGDRVAGPIDIDMKVTGRADAPDANGTIRLAGGSYSSPLNGVSLDNIALDARGGLQAIEITRFSATAPNGGTLSGSGRVRLDAANGFPAEIRITADNAEIISNELVDATISADLTLTGPTATGPALKGSVTINRMDIQLPDHLPTSVTPIAVEHVNASPAVQRQLQEEQAFGGGGGGGGYLIDLDLTVSTTNRIFVRGMGVDAQLGGSIQVRGTSDRPLIVGGFQLRRGFVDVIGQRIEFTRGIVTFTGSDKIDPELDLVASTTTSSITAQVAITGTASNPAINFSSSPELPQDEVLSHLLFDKATGQLSTGEAIQLAQAAAQFAGVGGSGPGMIDNIRKKLGLDVLQFTTAGADGAPAVGIGRYINDNIYLGVTQGATANSSRVTVDIDVTDRIRARGEVGADGSSSVGVNVEWDY
ncbi:translocation/assembly module TamB domain-containing protein [Microbaculum marinisediminis]|uniref:Translocation/assembly module TamB domain-containing protein n=1 Tax=Microbaculum marinisediminis TaxID=2931392 RepID=A0AAW5QZP8_9HYPH|nr:translocation/assembly module TamB domain-containing protein [Microbaculum sp. A6E488]MCT8973506.1 translocation/assembly module TamB domain-containing protein [Microbaculum sp. A6E488]